MNGILHLNEINSLGLHALFGSLSTKESGWGSLQRGALRLQTNDNIIVYYNKSWGNVLCRKVC